MVELLERTEPMEVSLKSLALSKQSAARTVLHLADMLTEEDMVRGAVGWGEAHALSIHVWVGAVRYVVR